MTALITADETQVEACREFIREYCDPEYLQLYDVYWAGDDIKRKIQVTDLQDRDEAKRRGLIQLHNGGEVAIYAEDGIEGYSEIGGEYAEHIGRSQKPNKAIEGSSGEGR